jgi:hypothetical protein
MEVTFGAVEDSDEFVMSLQGLNMKVDVKGKFDDKIESGFSTYTVEIYENNVLVTSDAFVNFPDTILLDYAPDSFNLDEVKGQFMDVSASWYEYFKQIKLTEEKKRSYIDTKLESGLYYE